MKTPLLSHFYSSSKNNEFPHSSISSLAPKILTKQEEIEKIQPYLDKLKETIEAKGVNNIALTGSYGSGKSTILKTFQNLNPQYKCLNISLASFNKIKDDNNNNNSVSDKKAEKEEFERLIELSILQQLFYHVKPTEIPESRFKRIINIQTWKLWVISYFFVTWVYCTHALLKYDYLEKIAPSTWNSKNQFDIFAFIVTLISFIGFGLFSKLIIKLFSNSKINKINIKGELEIGENISKSVFNEHIDEILYFFEMTKSKVVIIEDLDRFESTDIFTKLREINILLNNSKLINPKVNFIYAIGDDLFKDKKERVKFFEYIIPVIPFINASNADEQLKNLINESGLNENTLSKEFISDVITFIDDIDMRLLINIFHEFVIYRNTLKPEFIKKNEELFAIIIYKNLEPQDFARLNSRSGKLYGLINNKKKYIKVWISDADQKIKEKEQSITNINEESTSDFQELRAIYLNNILTRLPEDSVSDYNLIDLNDNDTFNNIINEEKLLYSKYTNDHYGRFHKSTSNELKFDFSDVENEVNPDKTYKERLDLIESKKNSKIDLLKIQLEDLKVQKLSVENLDLKQIFNVIDVDQYLKEFTNNKLLRNLILNGHINENYNDYISLFHEVSITKEDLTFERNVKSGYKTDFSFKLHKIENLIERIDNRYFERETILNFDLIDYLAINYSSHSNKYDSIIRILSNEQEKSFEFIDEYIKIDSCEKVIFINKLVQNWKGFWDFIYFRSIYSENKKYKYLELMIHSTKVEDLLSNQNIKLLKEAIERKPNFLTILRKTSNHTNFDKIKNLFQKLSIEFGKLDDPTDDTKDLFEHVYNNHNYKINKQNLFQMIRIFDIEMADKFNCSNYTTILLSKCKPLNEYINSNINVYIENVYLKLEDSNFENELSLIELLNNKNINSNLKIKIIQKTDTKISDLQKISDIETKSMLLSNNKVDTNWQNVIHYYTVCENVINESLVEFFEFEKVHLELSNNQLIKENKVFEQSLLLCNEISNPTYCMLLNSCYFVYNSLSFDKLNKEKVVCLIDNRLNTTSTNYNLLRENFAKQHISLVEKNFLKFFEKIDDFETDKEDVYLILKSGKITIKNKSNYITKIDQNIIVDSEEISKIIGEITLQNNALVKFTLATFESVIKNTKPTENKVKLISLYFDQYDTTELINVIKSIGWSYGEMFVRQHKPTFKNTPYNKDLFNKLKSKKLIKNFDAEKKDNTKLRVIANY